MATIAKGKPNSISILQTFAKNASIRRLCREVQELKNSPKLSFSNSIFQAPSIKTSRKQNCQGI